MAVPYAYMPLDRTTKSIRLVRLHPCKIFDAKLRCNILVVEPSLEDAHSYEAISYSWDGQTPNSDHIIYCIEEDGSELQLQITKNSHDALIHFRLNDSFRYLWIDSICIDQSSVNEKGHQVSIMSYIFAHAQRVLIWLGMDTTSRAKQTFEFLTECAALDPDNPSDFDQLVELARSIESDKCESQTSEPDESQDARHYKWSVMDDVFGRSWFKRMWTIQEIVLSDMSEATMFCGRSSIQWGKISSAIRSLAAVAKKQETLVEDATRIYSQLRTYLIAYRTPGTWGRLRSWMNERLRYSGIYYRGTSHPFFEIFDMIRGKEATDAKDKVFALFGLANELGVTLPNPDYERDVEDIYAEATKAIIQHDRGLEILYAVHSPQRRAHLPSWVPDWSDSWNTGSSYPAHQLYRRYRASGSSPALYAFGKDNKSLTLLSRKIGTISTAGNRLPVLQDNPGPSGPHLFDHKHPGWNLRNLEIWKTLRQWVQIVEELRGKPSPYTLNYESASVDGGSLGSENTAQTGNTGSNDGDSASSSSKRASDKQMYNRIKFAFYKTLMMDRFGPFEPGKHGQLPPIHPSLEEVTEQARVFSRWYSAMQDNSTNEFDQELLEANMIQEREEINEESWASYERAYVLWEYKHLRETNMIQERGEFDEKSLALHEMACTRWLNEDKHLWEYHGTVSAISKGKSFFSSTTGLMGVVDGEAKRGDVIALVAGMKAALVLSPVGDYFQIVGPAYVHGIMNGQLWPKTLDGVEMVSII